MWAAIAVNVTNMIGAGVFLKTRVMTCNVGSAKTVMLVWVAAGLLSLAGTFCYSEIAALMPEAGGDYVYLRRAYGRIVGFLFGWMAFAVFRTGCAGGARRRPRHLHERRARRGARALAHRRRASSACRSGVDGLTLATLCDDLGRHAHQLRDGGDRRAHGAGGDHREDRPGARRRHRGFPARPGKLRAFRRLGPGGHLRGRRCERARRHRGLRRGNARAHCGRTTAGTTSRRWRVRSAIRRRNLPRAFIGGTLMVGAIVSVRERLLLLRPDAAADRERPARALRSPRRC